MIVLHPYDPGWPAAFEGLRLDLSRALGARARRISHIGSTAVPGLAAKDILDVQVGVDDLGPDIAPRLGAAGYEFVPRHRSDHVPPGGATAGDDWLKLYFRGHAGPRRCHVHVRALGRANLRYALLFRDYLRAHPPAREAVERVKRELARLHADDADAYYAVKDPAYDLVWLAAESWAGATGWSVEAASDA